MAKIYALRVGNKSVSMYHRDRHYVIGFKTAIAARKMQYFMHTEPKFALVRDECRNLREDLCKKGYDIDLEVDVNATLFVPKCEASTPNDSCMHLHAYDEGEFLQFPIARGLGVVVPYKLEDETTDELMYKAYVIDPSSTLSLDSLKDM